MTGRMALVALVLAIAFAAAPAAQAGGWATVALDPMPGATRGPEPWVVELTVLQHGTRPLAGVSPRVLLTPPGGGPQRAVRATATDRPGVYRATIAFPSAGRWTYVVEDGFGGRHTFPDVAVAAPAATAPAAAVPDDTGLPWLVPAAVAAALGLALAAGVLRRRRHGTPALP